LDHKTLFFDLTPFDFYVLTEEDDLGHHFVGYFSKEKGDTDNNLSCILVMPFAQRSGYGKFLIEFSYELSIKEKRPGTPERPLSDLGHRSYVAFWSIRILSFLLEKEELSEIAIQDISNATGIIGKDVVYILENLKVLFYSNGNYYFFTEREYLKKLLENAGRPGRKVVREKIQWVPHIFRA